MTNESVGIIAILPVALIGSTLSVSVWLLTEKLKPGFLGKDVEIALEKMSITLLIMTVISILIYMTVVLAIIL